jgi:tRNA(Ile)-lysidine synthase
VPPASQPVLSLDTQHLRPGLRLAIGVSGGADSVALLRALVEQNQDRGRELGLVLHVAHLHHGLRGAEADADQAFVAALASQLQLPFHTHQVDTAAEAAPQPASNKPAETIEEAARRLRYQWFRLLMSSGQVDAAATAHTLDDQAETVLAKFLRGAWTEGLSGIHPVIDYPEGRILRPLLATTRAEVEAYLRALPQPWREDSTNRQTTFTRNRIRHELLPLLEIWNPRLREHLSQMAELARGEEAWWTTEVQKAATATILPGRPVRGGGRAAADGIALDIAALAALKPALQRRLLRYAAQQLGFAPDFHATEALRSLALAARAGQKAELPGGLRGERTHRELRLSVQPSGQPAATAAQAPSPAEFTFSVPGEVSAASFGLRLSVQCPSQSAASATLRPWKPGDRVHLRHSSGPRKVKEVLERLKISGSARATWPVVELGGRIVWMQGVAVEPEPGIEIIAIPF